METREKMRKVVMEWSIDKRGGQKDMDIFDRQYLESVFNSDKLSLIKMLGDSLPEWSSSVPYPVK